MEEWDAYGDRVSSVHIKDRVFGGSTVPLGTGAAQFGAFFRLASENGYRGLFVLQAARSGGEQTAVGRYKAFVLDHIQRAYAESR